jgi:hypothetical protein
VKAEDIREYRLLHCSWRGKEGKGKQPVRGGEQSAEGSESAPSPATMLSALNIGTTSSGSPGMASDPPTPASAPKIPQAQFYVEVPAPAPTASRFPAPPSATAEAAAPQLSPISSPAPSTSRPPIFIPNTPLPPPSSPAPTLPIPTSVAAASAAAGSSAVPFARQRLVVPDWRKALQLPPPSASTRSSRKRNTTSTTQEQGADTDLRSRVQSLEETIGELREWLHEDREWKRKVDERLRRANL